MTTSRILAAGAALALVFAAQSAGAAIALDGVVFQQVTAAFSNRDPVTRTGHDAWKVAGVPEDLTAAAAASAEGRGGAVNASSKITAHWDSADSGSIDYLDHGWSATAVNEGAGDEIFRLETSEAAPDWTYAFTATEDGTFDFGFALRTVATDAFGLGVWDLIFSAGPGSEEAIRFHGLGSGNFDDSGTVSRALLAGHDYRVSLVSRERLTAVGDGAFGGRNSTEFSNFTWAINGASSAAPEPSAWALAILGMGLAGATLRRRRALVAA